MRKFILLILLIIVSSSGYSQFEFEKNYCTNGNEPYNISPKIINTNDSGWTSISFSGNSSLINNFQISLTHLNKKGEVLWDKKSDLYTDRVDAGLGDLVQYPDSSLAAIWNDQNSKGLDYRVGIVHLDKNGNAIWGKKYSCPPSLGYISMYSLIGSFDNGLVGYGYSTAIPSDVELKFILKTDSAGNIKWCKQYYPDTAVLGLTNVPRIAQAPDSGFLFCFDGGNDTTGIGYEYLVKVDTGGNIQWAKRYGPNIGALFTKPQFFNGNIILPFFNNLYSNIEVLKTTMQGIPISNIQYTGPYMSRFYDAITDSSGNIYLSGLTSDTLGFIFKIDNLGEILWSHEYGKPDSSLISNLLLTLDGGILGYGWGPAYYKKTPIQSIMNLVKTDASGHDGCEKPFPVVKRVLPLTWQNANVKSYSVTLTQKDTILNFHSSQVDTIAECAIKPILKPIAKIYELKDTLCNGSCLCFADSSLNGPSSWNWSFPGASPSSSNVQNPCNICYSAPGEYLVMLIAKNIAGSDTAYDSVMVISPPVLNILGEDSICLGDSTNLTVVPAGLIYLWNTSSTNESITVKPLVNTYYYVSASNHYCKVKDSVDVIIPAFNANACCNATITQGQSISINASGGSSYSWSPTPISCNTCPNPIVAPLKTTTYTVIVTSSIGCKAEDSITITVLCRPVTACCDSVITAGETVQLSSSGGNIYYWSPSIGLSCDTCSDPIAKPTQNTTYTVSINDSGCISTQTVTIDITCGEVFVPDAFSPNNDGQNDYLYVRGDCIKTMDFKIFDRWGNMVFESTDKNIPWNGKYKGQPLNSGTYVYFLDATLDNGSTIQRKGNVALVR